MNSVFNIDMHCHPDIRPFCKSYDPDTNSHTNSDDINDKTSIWCEDPPNWWDKIRNILLSLTKFSQSNFTAIPKGNVQVISVSLAPIENGFFKTWLGNSKIFYCISNYITEFGKKKIRFIKNNNDYFTELLNEYDFYIQLDGKEFCPDGIRCQYKLTRSYHDIIQNFNNRTKTISVVFSIEGGYVFNPQSNDPLQIQDIVNKINKVKSWNYRPLFISLAHHFYHELSGHALSLPWIIRLFVNQKPGLYQGLTSRGKDVIRELLNNTNGKKRIYIDVKHMSRKARVDYYEMLDNEFQGDKIPIIVSHGALNGYEKVGDDTVRCKRNNGKFNGRDINFFDDEIVRIAKSNGLFCLQLDDRVIASKWEAKKIKWFHFCKKTRLKLRAGLVWNHVQRTVEILDRNGLYPWGMVAIGSDFDGMVDPPDGYWTSAYFPLFRKYLCEYAKTYIQSGIHHLIHPAFRNIKACDIIERIFNRNARRFLAKYYR